MTGWFTALAGTLIEAWQEVRLHRGRVLLSLIGVATAVFALAASVSLTDVVRQTMTESQERWSGRPVTLTLGATAKASSANAGPVESPEVNAAYRELAKRYGITAAGRVAEGSGAFHVQGQRLEGNLTVVDQPYGAMHRIRMEEGTWFRPGDSELLLPVVVINPFLWKQMGSPPLDTHPKLVIDGGSMMTALVIGIEHGPEWEMYPQARMLADHAYAASNTRTENQSSPRYEFWVPPEMADELAERIESDMAATLGDDFMVDLQRNDQQDGMMEDSLAPMRYVTLGVGGVVLVLGALGLLNIALVTVRQRVREIGIRRSFGATNARVFTAVFLESVVATFVAGVVGVGLAAFVMRQDFVIAAITGGQALTTAPAFPIAAALTGLVSAVVVGALAGLIPALVAVRVTVVDALRF